MNVQLTELLSPFNESFNHFMKAGEGTTGVSSTLDADATLTAAGAGDRETETVPFGARVEVVTAAVDVAVGLTGRTPAGIVGAVNLPFEPTVVQAPPTAGVEVAL